MNLHEIGRLPAPQDNCAIATRTLVAGTAIHSQNVHFNISHTVLEGHRFAVQFIQAGSSLTSWNMPFGRALRDIFPGEYVLFSSQISLHPKHQNLNDPPP